MNPALFLAPILIGYLLGSIPFGYVIVRLTRGIDIREYGSHNIGATNVLRVVGWFPALLTLLGDIGKGVLPPVLATLPAFSGGAPNPWVVVLSALAAIWGHAYSAFFYLKERRFARGKAVAAGAGALVGFVAAGQVRWPALVIVVAVWVAAIVLPKLFTGRLGWVSLASILAAVSMPLAFALVRAPAPYFLFGAAAALFVVWKHKENIGRLLDGVEPRLGERVPLAGVDKDEVACAFLIHPITPEDWWQTRRFSWAVGLYRLGLLPLGVVQRVLLLARPMKMDTLRGIALADGRTAQVHLIVVPWLPGMIKAHPKLAIRRAAQAARTAKELGARCVGLGAYWSVVGNKGQDVQRAVPEIPVTNGGAYTAGTVRQAVPSVFAKLRARGIEPEAATAVVVGANGVVGFGICRQLAGRVARLVMLGTNEQRLEKSAAHLRRRLGASGNELTARFARGHRGTQRDAESREERVLIERGEAGPLGSGGGAESRADAGAEHRRSAEAGSVMTEIVTGTDLAACREADILFTATSTTAPVVFDRHVKPGAILYDLGRPADVDESVFGVDGVTVIPGGVVRPPGTMRQRLDCHFGEGLVPACLAETILIALDECYDRVSLGDRTRSENIEHFVRLAEEYGFQVVEEAVQPPAPPAGLAMRSRAVVST